MNYPFLRPTVLVSRCLGFAPCRYNGQQLSSTMVELLRDHVDFVALCPEEEAGLGTPRQPIRLCQEGEGIEVFQPAASRLGAFPAPFQVAAYGRPDHLSCPPQAAFFCLQPEPFPSCRRDRSQS